MLSKILFSTVLAVSFFVHGYADTELTQKVDDVAGKYSVSYPKDWKVSSGRQLGVDFIAMAPKETNGSKFTVNSNVVTEELPSPMSVQDYFHAGISELNKLNEFKFIKSADTKIAGLDGLVVDYSYVLSGVTVRVTQYVVVKDKYALVLTFGSDPEEYTRYHDLFEQIANTLIVK